MFDEDIENEDELETEDDDEISLDEVDEVETAEDVDLDAEDDEDDEFPASKKSTGKAKSAEIDLPSLEAKNKERDELARAMEEFLARGGKIQEVNPAE